MIVGLGNDLLEYSRTKKVLAKFKSKFITRIATDNEIAWLFNKLDGDINTFDYSNLDIKSGMIVKKLSQLFAVKEAAAKALGTGIRGDVSMKSFELTHDRLGKPQLKIVDKAIQRLNFLIPRNYEANFHVAMTDLDNIINAIVIIEAIQKPKNEPYGGHR